jgi:hypothetical protein
MMRRRFAVGEASRRSYENVPARHKQEMRRTSLGIAKAHRKAETRCMSADLPGGAPSGASIGCRMTIPIETDAGGSAQK